MKNIDLITGDCFALADANASNPNDIYMIAENGGNNYAPLITTNNPSMKNRIGDYFPIESTIIFHIFIFYFLLPLIFTLLLNMVFLLIIAICLNKAIFGFLMIIYI